MRIEDGPSGKKAGLLVGDKEEKVNQTLSANAVSLVMLNVERDTIRHAHLGDGEACCCRFAC
jgi:hypothetical protein